MTDDDYDDMIPLNPSGICPECGRRLDNPLADKPEWVWLLCDACCESDTVEIDLDREDIE